jgi:hypothetical protein
MASTSSHPTGTSDPLPDAELPQRLPSHNAVDEARHVRSNTGARLSTRLLYDVRNELPADMAGSFSSWGYYLRIDGQFTTSHADSMLELAHNALGAGAPSHVAISWHIDPEDNDREIILVVDNGVGMNKAQCHGWGRVFERNTSTWGVDNNCGVSHWGEGSHLLACNECNPMDINDTVAIFTKKVNSETFQNAITPFSFTRGEESQAIPVELPNLKFFQAALHDLPKGVADKALGIKEMKSNLPRTLIEGPEYNNLHGTVVKISHGKTHTTKLEERRDFAEKFAYYYRGDTRVYVQLSKDHPWEELEQKQFLNTASETPVEIGLCVQNNQISVGYVHNLDAPLVDEKLCKDQGPTVDNLGVSPEHIVATLRISCHHQFGKQATKSKKTTDANKKALAAQLSPIKLNSPEESNGYMVGLMAKDHEVLYGSMQKLNEDYMSQIRSGVVWSKGDCIRFEFLVGPELQKLVLNLTSIKNQSSTELKKLPGMEAYVYGLVTKVFKHRKGGCVLGSDPESSYSSTPVNSTSDTDSDEDRMPDDRVVVKPRRRKRGPPPVWTVKKKQRTDNKNGFNRNNKHWEHFASFLRSSKATNKALNAVMRATKILLKQSRNERKVVINTPQSTRDFIKNHLTSARV